MSTSSMDFAHWSDEAREVERTDNPLNIPFPVAIDEAVRASAFARTYWEPTGDRPGLVRVKGRLSPDIAERILSLVGAVHESQTRLVLLLDPIVARHTDRARVVLRELESAIEFTLDDGVSEAADLQLEKLKAWHAEDGERVSTYAQALRDYAALGRTIRDRILEADSGFDVKLLDEADQLADVMERAAATPTSTPAETEAALVLRNRLLTLLVNEVAQVRKAAARVFRDYPEIVREVTSAYERKRRAAARKAKQAEIAASKQAETAAPPK